MEMYKMVTFLRARRDTCGKCALPARETRNHEKWASRLGDSVVDIVPAPRASFSGAPLFQLFGSPRGALGSAGGALALPGALKGRSKTR